MPARLRMLAPPVVALLALTAFVAPALGPVAAPVVAPVAEAWPAPGITVVAHRCNTAGDVYTEQTQAACVKALAAGASTIDADVRWTSTGTPVLVHDATLTVFGAPTVQVSKVSYTAARKYVSKDGQVVSTLTQVRDLVTLTDAGLSVELKTTPTAAQWAKFDAILAPVSGRVILNSFSPSVLTTARGRGYTRLALNATRVPAPSGVPAGVDVVIVSVSAITAPDVSALNAAGVAVWCFSCNTPAQWQAATDAGVTGFATDDHVAARAWIAAHLPA